MNGSSEFENISLVNVNFMEVVTLHNLTSFQICDFSLNLFVASVLRLRVILNADETREPSNVKRGIIVTNKSIS